MVYQTYGPFHGESVDPYRDGHVHLHGLPKHMGHFMETMLTHTGMAMSVHLHGLPKHMGHFMETMLTHTGMAMSVHLHGLPKHMGHA